MTIREVPTWYLSEFLRSKFVLWQEFGLWRPGLKLWLLISCVTLVSYIIQFSGSVMADSLWPHGLQHTRHPCPSPTPRACWNSCPSSQWCHPTISSFVAHFSSCLQSFPASGFFLMSQLFTSHGQSIWSFSFSIRPTKEYSGLISFRIDCFELAVQGALKSPLQHHSSKASILQCSAFLMVQFSHPYVTTRKTIALTRRTFVGAK